MSKKENIKKLYPKIKDKQKFIENVAEALHKRPNTLRHHWFSNSGFWSVPSTHEDKVIDFLQKTIATQHQ